MKTAEQEIEVILKKAKKKSDKIWQKKIDGFKLPMKEFNKLESECKLVDKKVSDLMYALATVQKRSENDK